MYQFTRDNAPGPEQYCAGGDTNHHKDNTLAAHSTRMRWGDERTTDGDAADGGADGSPGLRARLRERTRRGTRWVFSVRAFLGALAITLGMLVATTLLPLGDSLGSVAGLAAIFVAGFALGVVGWRRYTEVALAGGAAAAVGTILQGLALTVFSSIAPSTVLGAGSGVLAAVVGHYVGRDIHDGLTRE